MRRFAALLVNAISFHRCRPFSLCIDLARVAVVKKSLNLHLRTDTCSATQSPLRTFVRPRQLRRLRRWHSITRSAIAHRLLYKYAELSTRCSSLCAFRASFIVGALAVAGHCQAGTVITDGSLGRATTLSGPNFSIPSTLGQVRGGNLFQSFKTFDLSAGDIAAFSGPATVKNVITRVTGGAASNINGTLGCSIPYASFFLIDPSGVVFGPSAALNVQGSFVVTTANEIKMSDGHVFSKPSNSVATLTSAGPTAFGFLGKQPASVTVNGSLLKVVSRHAITVAAGPVGLSSAAALRAPDGTVGVLSVAGPTMAKLSPSGVPSASSSAALANISLNADTVIKTTGVGGGCIAVQAQDLRLTNSGLDATTDGGVNGHGIDLQLTGELTDSGGFIRTNTYGSGAGGNIHIQAKRINAGRGTLGVTGINSQVRGQASGTGGNINIHADRLTLSQNQYLSVTSYGPGHGGSVAVVVPQLSIDGTGEASSVTGIYAQSQELGNAGSIRIHAGRLSITSGGVVSGNAIGSGSGANVSVVSKGAAIDGQDDAGFTGIAAEAQASSTGPAGSVSIRSDSLSVLSGAEILGDTFALGRGGNVAVSAGKLTIDGRGNSLPTGIFSGTDPGSTGAAGSISVRATSASVIAGGEIRSDAFTTGDGGDISVVTGQLKIDARGNSTSTGIFSDALFGSSGTAGDVTVSAKDLTIDGGDRATSSGISSDSEGDGPAGTVFVHAKYVFMSRGAAIDTDADDIGRAGDVSVVAGTLKVDGRGTNGQSFISSDTLADDMPAGDVRIHARTVEMFNGADISSDTYYAGNGGNVSIAAESLLLEGTNNANPTIISADTYGDGAGGAVTVRSKKISTFGGGEISSITSGKGSGGDVVVESDTFSLDGSGSPKSPFTGVAAFSNFDASGEAGRLNVNANGVLNIFGGAQISTTARNAGGGDETIMAGRLNIQNGLITAAAAGVGGNITINATSLSLSPRGKISAASDGSGSGDNGGDISIGRTQLLLQPGVRPAAISANAIKGAGGNIIVAPGGQVLASQGINALVTLTATGSKPGTIKLDSPEVELIDEVAPLVSIVVENGLALAPTCGMQVGPDQSSFTLEGGNGLPLVPDQMQPSSPAAATQPAN